LIPLLGSCLAGDTPDTQGPAAPSRRVSAQSDQLPRRNFWPLPISGSASAYSWSYTFFGGPATGRRTINPDCANNTCGAMALVARRNRDGALGGAAMDQIGRASCRERVS
jgi:hypothetical protein